CDAGPLNATWTRFGPFREGADLHVHREHSDFFYVLAGELTLRLGPEGRPVAVGPDTLARVPPHVVHGFRNAADRELRDLNLHAPGMQFADSLRAIRDSRAFAYDQFDPPADGGRDPADAVVGAEPVVRGNVELLADVEALSVARIGGGAP